MNYKQVWFVLFVFAALWLSPDLTIAQLKAGVAKVDITDREAGPVNDPLYVKALALSDGSARFVIITLDVVALEGIGPIKDGYLKKVRTELEKDLNLSPSNILINASHCHGIVRKDVDRLTIRAVKEAFAKMVPVDAGAGAGYEDRIMENRRVYLKNGSQADMRRAYSLPPDEEVLKVGPIDPEVGILRLDKKNGETLAVVYNFAVHPIQGVPGGGNTADLVGYASRVIENNLHRGTMAFFLQGCGGDINPVNYKAVDAPPDAERLGNMLGLSVLEALKKIKSTKSGKITTVHETMDLPRADFSKRIESMEGYRSRLLESLRGTNMNFKSYLSSLIKYSYDDEHPSGYSHRYLHEDMIGRNDLAYMDSVNKHDMKSYQRNIYIMEELTRVQTNLALLRKNHAANAGRESIEVEMLGLKVGDFVLVTFPGELTVQVGLNIKERSTHDLTFVAGYTNGYIYYAPTEDQLRNTGAAQEDCDTLLAPDWQEMYEGKVSEILRRLL